MIRNNIDHPEVEILLAHFGPARIALVIQDLLQHFNTVVVKSFLVQVVSKLLLEVRVYFQVTRDCRECSTGVVQSHGPFHELLPYFLVLGQRQISE